MSGKREAPRKLIWQEAVLDRLEELQPPNHSAIAALAVALTTFANPDGTRVYPGQATMGRRAGLRSRTTVAAALEWLVAERFLAHVNTREAGLREYSLTFPGEVVQLANEWSSLRERR